MTCLYMYIHVDFVLLFHRSAVYTLYCETNQCALVMASLIGYSECLHTCVGILIDVLSVL